MSRPRTLFFVALIVAALPALAPAQAGFGEAPQPTPLDADHTTFWIHTTEDQPCSVSASQVAQTRWVNPLLYATGSSTDPCAAASEQGAAGVSLLARGGILTVHLLPVPDRVLNLTEGAPIEYDLWIWTSNAGGVSPRVTFRAPGFQRSTDHGAILGPADVQVGQGMQWQRFVGSLGPAPAQLPPGKMTLEVDLVQDTDVRQVGAFQSGVGTTGAHRSTVTVPIEELSDDPGETPWPLALDQATVRPGVQASSATGQCTTNFVYRSRSVEHAGLYLGLAAHCVDGVPLGGPILVRTMTGTSAFTGTLAFDSWKAIGFVPDPGGVGDDIHPFDFALIKVPAEHEGKVHPAVMSFGGPTGVQNTCTVGFGVRVIGFGNSGLRPGPAVLDEHEGVTRGRANGCATVELLTVTPGIPGDSGSGIMTRSGLAIGVASYLTLLPIPGVNGFSSVSEALKFLNADGWQIELVTWEIIKPGLSPV